MNPSIAITGTGAVSAAGWGSKVLLSAISEGIPIEPGFIERKLGEIHLKTAVRKVPGPAPASLKSARFRRSSPISKFAAAAALEAVGTERLEAIAAGRLRTGVIFTLINGCVNYSNRFFGEVLSDPAMASPILFPETVFNAPSSHLSSLIGSNAPNDTLIADGAGFFSGIDLAAEWLERGEIDGCLVVAGEEIDWLSAEGLSLYSRNYIPAEGAGAIYLEAAAGPVRLLSLPDPVSLATRSRAEAARSIRTAINCRDDGRTLLVDGRVGIPRFDRPETDAWSDWKGPRWSPRRITGEAMGASLPLQVVAAAEAIKAGITDRAIVTAVGGNQQAGGVLLGL